MTNEERRSPEDFYARQCINQPYAVVKRWFDIALAAAEARGLERAAEWHDAEEEKCNQHIKEMVENPLRKERCREDGSLHQMMGLAAEHREYATAIRALKEG